MFLVLSHRQQNSLEWTKCKKKERDNKKEKEHMTEREREKKISKQFYFWTKACQDASAHNPSHLELEKFILET